MNRNLLIAVLIAGTCIGLWKWWKERHAEKNPSFATTEQFIGYMCDHAVRDADTYDHLTPDYSIGSLKLVVKYSAVPHDQYVKNPFHASETQ